MSISIRLTPKSRKLLGKIVENTDKREFYRKLVKRFERRSLKVAGVSTKNYLSGQELNRRTGDLAKSVVGRGGLFGGVPGVRIGVLRGPALAYAGPQEYGTKGENPKSPYPTIVPKNAKALAMPVGPALTSRGVHRYTSPRGFPGGLRYVGARKGNVVGLLVPKSDTSEEPEAAYILLRKVDLKARYYLRDAMLSQLGAIADDVGIELERAVGGL